jgi:hypothetical protein
MRTKEFTVAWKEGHVHSQTLRAVAEQPRLERRWLKFDALPYWNR